MKKSRQLRAHSRKNHSEWTQQISPEPLPIPPPLPSPPPVPIPGTPENPINVDVGTRESPIEIEDDPETVARDCNDMSDKEFPFWGQVSPSIINDWEGRIDWGAVKQCGNCGSVGHGARWCRKGLTYDPETGFWYTNKSGEIWLRRGQCYDTHTGYVLFTYSFSLTCTSCMFTHLFPFDTHGLHVISCWLMLRLDGCTCQLVTQFSSTVHSL